MQIRTVAAIIVWIVVGLLLLNRILRSELVLPLAIILTIVAVIIYFSPRLMKKKKLDANLKLKCASLNLQVKKA